MAKITAFFTALFTWLTIIFAPAAPVEGIFTETEAPGKIIYEEGEFFGGKHKNGY